MKDSIKKAVYHLRKQPLEHKRHILNIFIFIAIVIMVLLYILSLSFRFNSMETKIKIKNDMKPFSTLKENISDTIK
ncbi:hypothetical protein K8Q94_00165 [Candidatus Nomurabacteria bacterium]|nr:hypothetical protein [Candidatus Nomurabacteria bacterium]